MFGGDFEVSAPLFDRELAQPVTAQSDKERAATGAQENFLRTMIFWLIHDGHRILVRPINVIGIRDSG